MKEKKKHTLIAHQNSDCEDGDSCSNKSKSDSENDSRASDSQVCDDRKPQEFDEEDPDNLYNFRSEKDMEDIRWLLMDRKVEVGMPFNTNVLRIALNMKEEKLAAILAAHYQVEIEESMIIRAIKTRQTQYFLYCVWAFNKNYEYRETNDPYEKSAGSEQSVVE